MEMVVVCYAQAGSSNRCPPRQKTRLARDRQNVGEPVLLTGRQRVHSGHSGQCFLTAGINFGSFMRSVHLPGLWPRLM